MRTCQDCQSPIPYGRGFSGSVCAKCRGKRAAIVNKAKAEKHGCGYFDKRSADARREAL